MHERKPTVLWVTGRKKALLSGIADELQSWEVYTDRDRAESFAERLVRRCVEDGHLAEFLHEYREMEEKP